MAMMTWMRRISPYLLAAVLIAFIVSLAYFGTQRGSNGGGGGAAVVTVDGDTVSAVTFDRAYRAAVEQTRQMAGDRWTEELPKVLRLREQVVERLIDERLVAKGAAREGIQVSDQELAEQIMRIGAFQEGGRFSHERYVRLLAMAQPPMSPGDFESEFRAELVRQRLQALIVEGAKVSEAEARQAWEADRSKVRAGYLLVTAGTGETLAVTDAELEAYYKAHPAEFTQPERRKVIAAILPTASVPAPTVTDADVEAAFKARRSQFEQPARTRVSHILVKVPMVGGSAAEDQAKARAESALTRIRGGADFAQVAREMSEDASTASRGGDLGMIAQGELVPEVDKAIQGMKPGEVTGPLRSPFGYHILKVFEVVPATRKELKEIAPTLRATLAAEGQMKAHRDKAQEAQKALLIAPDFAAEARKLGLTVREVGPLRRGEPIEGIGAVAEASDAIFTLPPDGVSGPVRVPGGMVIFRLVGIEPSHLLTLDQARPDVLRAVRRQKALEQAKGQAEKLAEAVRKGEDPRALVRQGGATYSEAGPFSRAEPLGDRALNQVLGPVAFTLPEGGVSAPIEGPGGFYVVKLLARERPDPAGFAAARSDIETRLLREKRGRLWQAWLAAARSGAKIEVNRQLLSEG
jgi:peptidyl-prolyl cis-trans isomerase D